MPTEPEVCRVAQSDDVANTALRWRGAMALGLLLAGIGVAAVAWLHLKAARPPWGTSALSLGGAALAGALLFIPWVRRVTTACLARARHPGPRSRACIALALAVLAGTYLGGSAWARGRDLFPRIHDEFSYQLGAQLLAHGRLWMPVHPQADFFESFHILVRPVYTSIYFPGTALMHAPGVRLGMPLWITCVALAGAIVGLTYRVVTEMVDGVAGLLASLFVIATALIRQHATIALAEAPVTLLALTMVWAWLRWRQKHHVVWAVIIGITAGWAAITRPADALAFALPVGVAIAWGLRGQSLRRWAVTAAALVLAAAPFLSLQLAFNKGVTGKWLTPPYVQYLADNQPGSAFGSNDGHPARPRSTLVQKQIYHEQFLFEQLKPGSTNPVRRAYDRAFQRARVVTPTMILLALIPLALLRLRRGPGWVLCVVPLTFMGLYTFNPHFLGQYTYPLVPAIACLVTAGAAGLASLFPAGGTGVAGAAVALAVAGACLVRLPEVNPTIDDNVYPMRMMGNVERQLATIDAPAVVLFRFDASSSVHEEPVYNSTVASPDDAKIIRAHDLGVRNAEIFQYYAAREPARSFYLFDRRTQTLTRLGTADQAAESLAKYDQARPKVVP